ncbi:energy-coupling factor ABC transporter ATP-binding protein [Arenibaculum sp.]|jgi:biotin transport system ATP-binding protein|uniref:energy-coupling factor ABC transporter ATP-binding protein n=1 Tax=Arenibaculum sp. TaxID=2865862 RepID=UPI002E0FF12B|nr:ATP-binding cassette domain-containing protein [Arenibaculum sp.]
MIELRDVSHAFGDRQVLKDVDLALRERRIAIVGSNGSGKSTFARLLNGLQLPTRGRVLVDGLDTRTHGRDVRRKVGFVFQNPDNQIVFPVVEEDLAFGLKNLRLGRDAMSERIDGVLARYGLTEFRHHPSHLLSGGQKQLLAISSVLVMEPEYVVFDEPTTLLDLRNKRRVAQAIRELAQTVVVVSHDLDLLADFDRVIVFEGGRVEVDDAPSPALRRYVEMMA